MKLPALFRSDSGGSDMSTLSKTKRLSRSKQLLDPNVGYMSEEIEAPTTSDIVFRKIWTIEKFHRTISRREIVDSPKFKCSVNGVTTHWNMAIRFWIDPSGKKITNPVVLCLNLAGCETEEAGQARVRFQLGAWDVRRRRWDCCPISNIVIHLENSFQLHSLGYETLKITKRHFNSNKDVSVMVKIQVIHHEEEVCNLSQDLARVLSCEYQDLADTIVECSYKDGIKTLKAHSFLIRARSAPLASRLVKYNDETTTNIIYKLSMRDVKYEIAYELFRYIYSDKVDNAEANANRLLPLSTKYHLPGLTVLCERALLENLTPNNVANVLLLANECGCDNLRKSTLNYCEESEEIKNSLQSENTIAWRVMEMINPDLFLEACESLGNSSSNIDTQSSTSSSSDN